MAGSSQEHVRRCPGVDGTFLPKITLNRKVKRSAMTNIVSLPARKRARPNIENRKVLPKRGKNADRRSREYLTPDEVTKLINQAGKVGRHGQRDAALMTLAYRHGLRVSELVALRWDMVDLKQGRL